MKYHRETWKTTLAVAIITIWGISMGLGLYGVGVFIYRALGLGGW